MENTKINSNLSLVTYNYYTTYLGGFIGYSSSSSVTLNITGSEFINGNSNSDVECLVGGGYYTLNIDS